MMKLLSKSHCRESGFLRAADRVVCVNEDARFGLISLHDVTRFCTSIEVFTGIATGKEFLNVA